MTNKELLDTISNNLGLKREIVEAVITECTDIIIDTVSSGESVLITRLGKYYPLRETRGRNVHTRGAEKAGDSGVKLKFRTARNAKDRVAKLAEEKGTSL